MADQLWEKARTLAARDYSVSYEVDEMPDGRYIYMVRNPELPGCKAQGDTIDEAASNLDEARLDYIWALLDENLPVPDPVETVVKPTSTIPSSDNVTIATFSFGHTSTAPTDNVYDMAIPAK